MRITQTACLTVLTATAWGGALAQLPRFPQGGMIADYSANLREAIPRADGIRHTDTHGLIEKLQELHATTFFYLLESTHAEWDDFRNEFVPAAQQAGIDVWAYLVPPSECCAQPFGTDYIRWATELATLSTRYPNVKGFAIDDFQWNLDFFTPEFTGRMVQAAKAVNPSLLFFPQVYWKRSTDASFLDAYTPWIDGLIMAYRDDPYTNTYRSDSFSQQIAQSEEMLAARHKALVLMVYCHPLGRNPLPPPADYISKLVGAGMRDMQAGKLYGVVTYVLDKGDQPAPPSLNQSHSGSGRATFLIAGPLPDVGKSGEISRAISVDPAARGYALSFWHTEFFTRAPVGFYSQQVLLDDQVVWEQDIAQGPPRQWRKERVNVAHALAGKKTASLRFRVVSKQPVQNLELSVGFDDIEAEGFRVEDPGFENQTGWATRSDTPAILPLIYTFDPQLPIEAFRAVRDLYGPYALVQSAYQSCASSRMEKKAAAILRTWQAANYPQAAHLADSLAKAAGGRGCERLAGQARRVAEDLGKSHRMNLGGQAGNPKQP